jgi:hypothetical protein
MVVSVVSAKILILSYKIYLIVNLPDGMYTVKTFHDQPKPIKEFVIGKP